VLDPKIFDHSIDIEGRDMIRCASFDDVVAALYAWFDSWLNVNFIDWEYIMYAGGDVGSARNNSQEAFDLAVLEWLKKKPDPFGKRHFIVASFLEGYWGSDGWVFAEIDVAVSFACTNHLLDFLKQGHKNRCGYTETLCALHTCLHRHKELDIEVRRSIQKVLVEHLEAFEQTEGSDYMLRLLACIREHCGVGVGEV